MARYITSYDRRGNWKVDQYDFDLGKRRYEVHVRPAFWIGGDYSTAMGWHDTLQGAQQMADSAVLHPEATEAWIIDLHDSKQVYETRKPTR